MGTAEVENAIKEHPLVIEIRCGWDIRHWSQVRALCYADCDIDKQNRGLLVNEIPKQMVQRWLPNAKPDKIQIVLAFKNTPPQDHA